MKREECLSCQTSPDCLFVVQFLGEEPEIYCLNCLATRYPGLARSIAMYLVLFKGINIKRRSL